MVLLHQCNTALSHYPPGVTGAEYAVAGPDWEEEEEEWCQCCGQPRRGVLQGYAGERWFLCGSCGSDAYLGPLEPDYDAAWELQRDLALEAKGW